MSNENLPVEQNEYTNLLGKPYQYDWAVDGARQALAEHNRSGIALGLYIKAIKENEDHGMFVQALEKIGIHERMARRYKKRAEFILSHHEKFKTDNLSVLNGSKIDRLIALPQATLAEVIDEDGHIAGHAPEELQDMTTNQFAEIIAAFQSTAEHASQELEETKKELYKTRIHLSNAKQENDELKRQPEVSTRTPYPVAKFRQESAVISLAVDSHLDTLSHMIDDLKEPMRNQFPMDQYDAHLSDCAKALYQSIKTLYAKSGQLMQQFDALLPDHKIETPADLPFFDEQEARSIHTDFKVMLQRSKVEAEDREHMRQARTPKKRGRPTGSKNKP